MFEKHVHPSPGFTRFDEKVDGIFDRVPFIRYLRAIWHKCSVLINYNRNYQRNYPLWRNSSVIFEINESGEKGRGGGGLDGLVDTLKFSKKFRARKKLIREEFCRATVRARIKWMSDVKFTIYNGREYNGSAARSQLSDNARLRRYLFISSVTVDDAITSEFINLHANARHRFIIPHELKDRSNGERERERKKIGWFLDQTAATLYSTRHRRNAGREGAVVDCSKLHQRRDNRVVDCVDRYSIFAELVAARRQPIARKIQLSYRRRNRFTAICSPR